MPENEEIQSRKKTPKKNVDKLLLLKPSFSKKFIKELWTTFKKPLLVGSAVIILIILLIPVATYLIFAQDIQDKDRILNRNASGIILLDHDGNPFFTFYQPKQVTYTDIANVPINIQHAVVSAEDRDFYTNPGFSIRGILRAFKEDILTRGLNQGGSTITQELVKNALLTSERNFLRKYQELVLSIEISRRYSKQDILELYMNAVYFGEGAFGIENAAQAYFGIHSNKLDLAQSALLASLLPAPSALSPLSNDPEKAKIRQERVLDAMVKQGYVSARDAEDAKQEKLIYKPKKQEETNTLAPHFAIMVKDELIKKYGEETVIRSGFKVTTTLNKTWQEFAEKTIQKQVANLKYDKVTNGAAVVLDPQTGEIKALVGSVDWNNKDFGKVNMVIAPRQPGSSFKPFIYADALEQHIITAATILDDKPITFGDGYAPLDFDRKFRGEVTVRRALANSLNIPAVEVMEKVGVKNGVAFAQNMGITTLDSNKDYGLPLVLGAAEVKLLDLTSGYASFANRGEYITPADIVQINDKYGKTIYTYTPETKQAVDADTAYLISSILSDNIARAEEFGDLLNVSRTTAVKTGTTSDYKDSLTIGYTPSITIGVWVGNNDNTPMDNVAGAIGAAPIWRNLMNHFFLDLPDEKFEKPLDIVQQLVCPYKGLDTSFSTSSISAEFFLPGTAPEKPCENPTPTPNPSPTPTATPNPTSTPVPTDIPTATPIPTAIVPTLAPTNIPTPTVSSPPTPTISP